MARLSDLPHVLRSIGPFSFLLRVWKETFDDSVFTWAAALAYSWMFSIFPFLIFLIALLPYMPSQYKSSVEKQIDEQVTYVAPSAAGESIRSALKNLLDPSRPTIGILSVGIALALIGASGGMNATMAALDRCYDVEIGRKYFVQRGVAILLTMSAAVLILLVLCLVPVTTQIINSPRLSPYINIEGFWRVAFDLARYFIALVLCLTILSLIYHFGPSVRSHWTWISPGSLFVVAVWGILAFGFRYYIDHFAAASYAKTYGVVGSIVLLLLVLYVDAIVLLIGAEINSEIDFAVLGLTSNSTRGMRAVAREDLSDKEKLMLLELQRRRPAATAMAAQADAAGGPRAPLPDAASQGAFYPMEEPKQPPAQS